MIDAAHHSELGFEVVREQLLKACEQLLNEESELFFRQVNERSLTHRLAVHLERRFPGYHVDCEYNRDCDDPKRLPITPKDVSSDDTRGKTVYPDIVVHRRGSQKQNLLVIEAKKNENVGKTAPTDEKKLFGFTKQPGHFKYRFGAFVNFRMNASPLSCEIRWYENGKFNGHADPVRAVNTAEGGNK